MSQIDITEPKKCIKCAHPKSLTEFYRNPKNSEIAERRLSQVQLELIK